MTATKTTTRQKSVELFQTLRKTVELRGGVEDWAEDGDGADPALVWTSDPMAVCGGGPHWQTPDKLDIYTGVFKPRIEQALSQCSSGGSARRVMVRLRQPRNVLADFSALALNPPSP